MFCSLLLAAGLALHAPGVVRDTAPGFSESPWPGQSSFQSYGPDDDLMSMGISALAQDTDGLLWVGSDLGLYRFDGHHFLNIGSKEGLPSGPDSHVWADPRGGVWTSSFAGLFQVVDLEVRPASGVNGLPPGPVVSMAFDGSDRAWVALGAAGLFKESSQGTFEKVEGAAQPFIVARAPRHGGMLVLREEGYAQLWTETALAATWSAKDGVPSSVVAALEDGRGRIWILSTHGLWLKALGEKRFHEFTHPALAAGGDYRDLQPDGKGGIWVATVRGLLHINGDTWTHVTDREGMPTKSAAQVLVDREGSLWYASNGLFRELGLGAWHNQTIHQGLPTEIVWTIARDKAGRLWAGTNMGLAVQEGGSWSVVPGSEKTAILSLVALPDGGLVAAGRPRALLYVRPGATRAVPVQVPFQDLPAAVQVYRVFADREGNAWVNGSPNLQCLVSDGQTLRAGDGITAPDPAYLQNAYTSLQARDGRFWFASRVGLVEFFHGRWRRFKKEDGLLEDSLYGLAEAADGTLLISYYDSLGVSRLRLDGDRLTIVRHYRMDRGELPTDSVFSIHRDRRDRLWLLTDVGAVLLEETGFTAFGRAYGMESQDMAINSFLADRDGVLWFGNARSLARFDSTAFPWNLPVPKPVFQDLRFGGRPVSSSSLTELQIQPRDNALETSLSFASYSRANAFTYEVRIDDLDRDFRKEKSAKLHYLALPAGSYTLRARAIVNGRPGPEAKLPFRILPRWHELWPVRLLLFAASAALVWVLVAWRLRRLRLTNDRLEALVKSQMQAEESLRKLSVAVEQSPVAVMITDANGDIEFVNPRFTEMTGYSREEAIGKNPRLVKSDGMDPNLHRELWQTITGGDVWEGELCNRKKNGELFYEHASISPVRNAAGVITHYLALHEDVTAHKGLEEQLRQSQKMEAVGLLAGGVAHDFNNLLSVILGNAGVLRSEVQDDSQAARDLDGVLEAGQRAAKLTRSLLAFGRKGSMTLTTIDLHKVILQVDGFLHRVIGEDVHLQTSCHPRPLLVRIDTGQLEQVLVNLVTNARDAMEGGGRITIETALGEVDHAFAGAHAIAPGPCAVLSVSDTGAGMDPSTLGRIFEPFFTTKEVGKGTGLGLAIVYRVVQQNRGAITVTSEKGRGTTFRIYLPLAVPEAAGKSSAPGARASLPTGTETILVVEDDPHVRRSVASLLERRGYRIILAEDGQDAIAKFDLHGDRIGLVLMDLIMPKLNGKRASEEILRRRPGTRILLTSGYSADIIENRGELESGVDLLMKPVLPDELLRRVRQRLDA